MQKKVAAIHDISGVGKCSLTVALPVLSALKVQCCPFPTAVLSNQVGYPEYSFLDLTDEMPKYTKVWDKLGFEFNSIYTGFLGSKQQVDIVSDFIENHPDSFVVVDPVMGDNGEMYSCFNEDMRIELRKLVCHSHLTTPNLTEACYLASEDYSKLDYTDEEIMKIAHEVSDLGPEKIVITGIVRNGNVLNFAYDRSADKTFFTTSKYNNKSYSGTGDIFASILCGMLTNDFDFELAVNTANEFIYKTITYTSKFDTDRNEGVMFENFLGDLASL
ncbi:pyridoxamine kinase [Metaclostridioides mangenotii]|uniref:pyridoxamine kinase n=1 Tax=Metaclostridioides mangenotii TaxID=1540 RepID=UPI000483B0E9|nr:pyridoxamine kinase [Clostridioides mangenotii]